MIELTGRQIHSLAALVKDDLHPWLIRGPEEESERSAAVINERGEVTFPGLNRGKAAAT